jgi:maltose O-acetyltransferase
MKIKTLLFPIREIKAIINAFIIFWPTSPFGQYLRTIYYGKLLKSVGEENIYESGVRFGAPDLIEIGDSCIFGRNVNINAGNCNGVYIGSNVAIADGTYLRSANHSFSRIDIPIRSQSHYSAEISFNNRVYSVVVEDDVWIGARAIILSGARIGKGSIIAAGAMVSGTIPPYSIVIGNPGKITAMRKYN